MLLESMGMDTWPTRDPRYNIAPTQTLDVIQADAEQLVLRPMSWGVSMMLPGKTGMVTKRIQNSRSDKVWQSRLWKPMIEHNRVLVPVNGFYEWKRRNRKLEAAYHIHPAQGNTLLFAGICKFPKDDEGRPEVSIITTEANEPMSEVHDRMPVILSSHNAAMAWLQETDKHTLNQLMSPAGNEVLQFTQVSDYVNKSSNEGPACIEPLAA